MLFCSGSQASLLSWTEKLLQKQVLSQEINDSRDLEINSLCSRMCVADDFFYGIPGREAQHIKFACFYGNQVQTLQQGPDTKSLERIS